MSLLVCRITEVVMSVLAWISHYRGDRECLCMDGASQMKTQAKKNRISCNWIRISTEQFLITKQTYESFLRVI